MTPENINILRQIEEICDLLDYVKQMKDLESPKLETILSDIWIALIGWMHQLLLLLLI